MSRASTSRKRFDGPVAITRLGVAGLKSIATEQSIEIKPLTILAGANSSGKSTLMQGVLLLKQTLEAPYDPGPLLISGPNVDFTSTEQMLPRPASRRREAGQLRLVVETSAGTFVSLRFSPNRKKTGTPYHLVSQSVGSREGKYDLTADMGLSDVGNVLRSKSWERIIRSVVKYDLLGNDGRLFRDRCFFNIMLPTSRDPGIGYPFSVGLLEAIDAIEKLWHLPGMRGAPSRDYPVAFVGNKLPGVFNSYVASIVANWGGDGDDRIEQLGSDLGSLNLTWKVEAKSVNGARIRLQVGRLKEKPKRRGVSDLVNIADVGLGVSQTLPVVVALLAAEPGQLVYIEQPEIHLHPKAQVAMARLLANAAARGVRVVVETHSALLLTGIQTLVAKGELEHDKVILHWFQRDDDGWTNVTSADLDEAGRFEDWPVDFADVTLEAESRYLDAAEAVLYGKEAGR